ncbi:MAG: lipid-A-disaccharide synthase, partial [bacterium]
ISYQIARKLVRVPYISLVNLIMEREVVRELIQDEMNATNLAGELRSLLYDPARRERLTVDYSELQTLLAAGGLASEAAAARIVALGAEN